MYVEGEEGSLLRFTYNLAWDSLASENILSIYNIKNKKVTRKERGGEKADPLVCLYADGSEEVIKEGCVTAPLAADEAITDFLPADWPLTPQVSVWKGVAGACLGLRVVICKSRNEESKCAYFLKFIVFI